MKDLSQYILESNQLPIRREAILDWRKRYRGGTYWTKYLKEHPRTITQLCAALVDKSVDNWNGRKGVFIDFINMLFGNYIGTNQELFVYAKNFKFEREEGVRSCSCILYDKWNHGEIAQLTFKLVMDSESDIRRYRADKFSSMSKRKLIINCDIAKYKKDLSLRWVHLPVNIIKVDIPPINDTNRQQLHGEIVRQMLDAAHYMNWGYIDPQNITEE